MEAEMLDRKIEHHRSEMLRFCRRAVCIDFDKEEREKSIRRAEGHEIELKKLLKKKKRLLDMLKASK